MLAPEMGTVERADRPISPPALAKTSALSVKVLQIRVGAAWIRISSLAARPELTPCACWTKAQCHSSGKFDQHTQCYGMTGSRCQVGDDIFFSWYLSFLLRVRSDVWIVVHRLSFFGMPAFSFSASKEARKFRSAFNPFLEIVWCDLPISGRELHRRWLNRLG